MRVLGVDPGLTRCGLGVVEGRVGSRLSLVHVDVCTTQPDLPVAQRLLHVDAAVEAVLAEFQPDAVAVERVFSQHNVRSAMSTAQAGAVAMVAAARRGLPVASHTPTEVKAAVTGNGDADKSQVAAMVMRLLGLTSQPRPADATDAIALAICHVWRTPLQQRRETASR